MTHDYEGFYDAESSTRRDLSYPPFGRLARIISTASATEPALAALENAASLISKQEGMNILGPAAAVIEKIGGLYRFSLVVRGASAQKLVATLAEVRKAHAASKSKARLVVDVDPVSML